jgi:toxin ParE1/3/4
MTRVIISPRADTDVDEIVTYLAGRGGSPLVQQYLDRFDAVYARLAEFPGSGPRRPRLGAQARIAVVSPYVIIYYWDDETDAVLVLRIVRGSRRITRRLARES